MMKSSLQKLLGYYDLATQLHPHWSLEAETLITHKKDRNGLDSSQVTLPLCCSLDLEYPSKTHTLKVLSTVLCYWEVMEMLRERA